ncbi:MAG: ArsB/NhaD family transporter [Ardenticatenaceae bacterium]|nr:ArsB/NhaD family transporter [Ardenticatenaceae bacterium]
MSAILISSLIFAVALAFIFTEKVHRTIVGIVGAVAMVGAGLLLGFYSEEAAVQSIDFETLALLFGMMILVALLQPTGFFQYLAIMAGRWSKGSPVRLFILLGTLTTVLSMFLDNVTTVVLIAPVTILITEILGLSPVPFLVSAALLSNTGGVATLVGDPPNVLIGSAVGLTFNDFLTHSLPIIVVVWLASLGLLVRLSRTELGSNPAAAKRIKNLDPTKALEDPKTARKILIVLGTAVILFFIHHLMGISPAYVALLAAAAALMWVRPEDLTKIFEHVEWPVLIFFAALFVMVGGVEASGAIDRVAELFVGLAHNISPRLFGVLMIWVVALLSAVVDNIPITVALIPVLQNLSTAGIDVTPLWWALAFGTGLGGNGTIIGSTANVVVVSLSEKTRHPITAAFWLKRGLPVMLLSCTVVSVLYAIFFPLFTR